MTRKEFEAWIERRYRGNVSAAAREMGINRETVEAILRGETRSRAPKPIPAPPRYVELLAAAVELGVQNYDGGPLHIALGRQPLKGEFSGG